MADIFDAEKRSQIMSQIKGRNTKPELIVHRYLRRQGVYHQRHYRAKNEGVVLDVALPRKKKAVFIDGDFWHGRTIERVVQRRGEDDFWTKKLKRNIERDSEQRLRLSQNGWSVLRVWETDLMRVKTREQTLRLIHDFLATVN